MPTSSKLPASQRHRRRILHLGFHGSHVGTSDLMQSPMESGLYLQDRHLDGLDLSGFDTGADVVVVMACHAASRRSP